MQKPRNQFFDIVLIIPGGTVSYLRKIVAVNCFCLSVRTSFPEGLFPEGKTFDQKILAHQNLSED